MDRGIPNEEGLREMRAADRRSPIWSGTPRVNVSDLEKALLELPWQWVRAGWRSSGPPQQQEDSTVLAQSRARTDKERAMRRRELKWRASGWGALRHGPHA